MRAALKLNQEGFEPDLIIGHSGFGSTLFLKEIWPQAKFLGYFEWFYKSSGSDVGYIEKGVVTPDAACRIHTYNAPILMDLAVSDKAVTPTIWQKKQFPDKWQETMEVIFDGVDTKIFSPKKDQEITEKIRIQDLTLDSEIPLVTYTTRGFEEYRGWPQVAEGIKDSYAKKSSSSCIDSWL